MSDSEHITQGSDFCQWTGRLYFPPHLYPDDHRPLLSTATIFWTDMAPPPVIEHLSALENFKVARSNMKQLETVHTLSYKWRWQVTDSLFGRLSYGT